MDEIIARERMLPGSPWLDPKVAGVLQRSQRREAAMRAAHTDPGYQPRVSQDPTVRKNHGPIYNPGKVEAAMNAYYAEHPPLREWKPRTHEPTTAPKITPDQSKPAAKPSGDVPPGRPSVAKIKPASAPVSKPQEPKPESTAEQKLERDARRASEHAQHALERSNQATAAVKQFGEQHPFRKWAHDHNVVRSEEYTKLQSHARHAERRSVEAYNDSLSANLNVGKHKEELKQATPEKAPTYGKVDGRDSITLTKPGVGNDFQHGASVDPMAARQSQPPPHPQQQRTLGEMFKDAHIMKPVPVPAAKPDDMGIHP